jgi:hypothetical protein
MSRETRRRIERLETRHEDGAIRYDISDKPLEWDDSERREALGLANLSRPLTDEEWEALYCKDESWRGH